jgi:hypothetical protein
MCQREGENEQADGEREERKRETVGRILFVGHTTREREKREKRVKRERERARRASSKIAVSTVAANQRAEVYTHARICVHRNTYIFPKNPFRMLHGYKPRGSEALRPVRAAVRD